MSESPTPIDIENIGPLARRSIFNVGRDNLVSSFASSYIRAQSYLGLTFFEDQEAAAISPCTSRHDEDPTMVESTPQEEISDGRGHNNINTFSFPHDEEEPLLEEGSVKSLSIKSFGKYSTAPQTVFNAVNTLIGIGMLSLPYGMKISGWLCGSALLFGCALVTNFTAKLLGRILKKHPELSSYGDIAHICGGHTARVIVTFIFSLDLIGAMVSLIILFSDSFSIILPVSEVLLKFIIVAVAFVLSFVSLSFLSLLSLFGIVCTSGLLVLLVICGIVNKTSPGSLISPEQTGIWPSDFKNLLFSLGIMMAPWGGHPVFPELFKDMKQPVLYDTCCNVSFGLTYCLDYLISVVGYLMFGILCEDSIAKNMMKTSRYPAWVQQVVCLFMGILPISKLPLVARPLITVYENFFKLNDFGFIVIKNGKRQEVYTFKRILARVLFYFLLFILSIKLLSFGKVIAFLGSAICITVCMTLPFVFYLKLFESEIPFFKKLLLRLGIWLGILASILGTYGCIAINLGELDSYRN